MSVVHDEEDRNLIHERYPPERHSCLRSKPCYAALAASLLFLGVGVILGKRYSNADNLQEYIDKECVSPFSEAEFTERTKVLQDGGEKVCTLPVRASFFPMEHRVALLGMTATDEIRNIVNVGTRISTMSRECDPARQVDKRFPNECVSEHGFWFASLADYRNDVYRALETSYFRPERVVVLVSNPFDTAFRIYRRKKACDTNVLRFMCDIKKDVIVNDAELRTDNYKEFSRVVFKDWYKFMRSIEESDHKNITTIYLDDFLSPRKRLSAAHTIFEVVYDEWHSPEIEDSENCLEAEAQQSRVFPVEYNKDYSRFFSNETLQELCDIVGPYWDSDRWKNEC